MIPTVSGQGRAFEQLRSAAETRIGRRGFLGATAAGLGTLGLAACGGPSTSSKGQQSSSGNIDYSGVKPASEITFWSSHPGTSQKIEQKLIDKFHASNPGIKVTMVTAGADYEAVAQKFQTAQASKQLPDIVIFSDVWWFRYFLNGSIIPLDSVLKKLNVDTGDYRKGLYDDYQYKGQQWAVPYARSTPLFYYNKQHWKAAGLPDRAPSTWDEFDGWAQKLMKIKSKINIQHAFQYGAIQDYAGWTMQNNLWGWGGAWSNKWDITCDSDASVQAIQWIQDSVYTKKWAGVASSSAITDMMSGAASATISSTGDLITALTGSKYPIGVGFLPGGPKVKKPVCPTGGAGLGIPKGISKSRQLAAATFLKFLTSPESTAAFSAATGYMPVRESADMTAVLKKTPEIGTALKQLAVTRKQDYARVFLPGGDIELSNAMSKVLTQHADVKQSMTALKTTLQKIYDTQVKNKI